MLGSGERACRPRRYHGSYVSRKEPELWGNVGLLQPCREIFDMLMRHDSGWETLMTSISLEFWAGMLSILSNYAEQNKLDLGHYPHCPVLKQFTSCGSPMR